MPTYSADEIINKTLTARQPVEIKRSPTDAAPVVYTVKVGQPVGQVYSWLAPDVGRSRLYWMFYDANNRPYYAEHKEGRFDIGVLKDQGAQTTEEKTQEEQRANETFGDKIERYAKYILIGGAVLIGGSIVLNARPWEKKRYA